MAKFNRLVALCLLLLISIGIHTAAVSAQETQNFVIKSFDADYFLNRNAQKTSILNVVERITAQFPDFDQNHGILRAIPQTYQDHTASLSVESVKDLNGNKLNYSTYEENDNLVLKIGDADRYVHGQQTYVIRYSVRNVILFLNDHDEFYWDINGDQWPQRFDSVVARIHIPKTYSLAMQDRLVCYAGPAGGKSSDNCTIAGADNGSEILITAKTKRALDPNQTLTTVLGFNKGVFALGPEVARQERLDKLKLIVQITSVSIPPLIAFGFMFRRWRQFGNDPKGRGVIIPEYEPPKGLNILTSDYLLQQKLRNLAFSAAIIDLAVKRYLTIYEIKQQKTLRPDSTDYELELSKPVDGLTDDYKSVIGIMFEEQKVSERVKLSELKKSSTKAQARYKQMEKLEKSLASDLATRAYFIKNPRSVRQGYLVWAGILFFGGFICLITTILIFPGVGLMLAAVVVFIFAFIMPARTEQGVLAHDALLGLKDYIKLAEADRLKFLQSPQGAEKITSGSFDPKDPKMQVKLFESLLPYAILFGLEKQWAKQFESIYTNPPDWYHGNWTAFNTGFLAGSLSNFSSASSMTFVSPSSSSSSGFSGGSSGGGGGGGGGGGW